MTSEDYILKPVVGKSIKLFAEVLGAFNGGFEDGPSGLYPDQWADDEIVGTFGPLVADDTNPAHSGSFSGRVNIVYTGTPNTKKFVKPTGFADHMEIGLNPAVLTKGFPVIPKYKYIMEAWGKKSDAAHIVKPAFKWYDGTGLITHSPTEEVGVVGVGAFEKIHVIDFAPANARSMNGLIFFGNGTGGISGNAWIDDVKLFVPLGICTEIKFKVDPQLTPVLEWGNVNPVENKERSNVLEGSFKNYHFSLYAWYLAKRLANGALPEFDLRIIEQQGAEVRAITLPGCKLGMKEFSASFGDLVGESYDFKFKGEPIRESGGGY